MQTVITNIQGYSIHDGPGIRTVVFLKGCSLKCAWCANPECISPEMQVGFIENLCSGCRTCLDVCPTGAIVFDDGKHRIDYGRCTACGLCADSCLYRALVKYGQEMTVEEVFDAVRRDKMFYESGGGVTVSGGEPLLQAPFVRVLFELCRGDGIDTCVETSGCAGLSALKDVLPLVDHLLFDLKFISPEQHLRWTGRSNDLILRNARYAAEQGADILFRMPLIPTVNDNPENIEATAVFIKSILQKPRIQLMPYHRLGDSKYKALGREYGMSGLQPMKKEDLEAVRQSFADMGVDCTISR